MFQRIRPLLAPNGVYACKLADEENTGQLSVIARREQGNIVPITVEEELNDPMLDVLMTTLTPHNNELMVDALYYTSPMHPCLKTL